MELVHYPYKPIQNEEFLEAVSRSLSPFFEIENYVYKCANLITLHSIDMHNFILCTQRLPLFYPVSAVDNILMV